MLTLEALRDLEARLSTHVAGGYGAQTTASLDGIIKYHEKMNQDNLKEAKSWFRDKKHHQRMARSYRQSADKFSEMLQDVQTAKSFIKDHSGMTESQRKAWKRPPLQLKSFEDIMREKASG